MDELTRLYQSELRRTRTLVQGHVEKQWRALPDYRDNRIQPFLSQVLPVVKAGQDRAVSLTSAYLSKKLALPPVGLDLEKLTGAGVRNGVDPEVVYRRPFETVWSSIYKIGITAAVLKGLDRLMSTASMDVAMSARDASTAFAQQSDRVVAWQRVADPNCCDFCLSIDGAKILSDDPAPLHNNCGCTVEPLETMPASDDNWLSVSPGSTMGDSEIQEHGEMGPVLVPKDSEFTTVADLPDSYEQEIAN